MQVKTLLLAVCWIAVSFPSFARDKIALSSASTDPLKFVRNEGQIKNQYGHLRPELHTRMKVGKNLNVFTGTGLLVYQWQGTDAMYRMEARLVGASTDVQPVYEMPFPYTERYIGSGKEITARSSGRIVYAGVYPNIDWVLYATTDGHLKYDFVVQPGGKVSDIKMQYSGATALSLQKDGSLSVLTPVGSIGEHAPVSYTREGKAVGSRFVLQDSTVTFAVDDYEGTLVIDPELEWSTYYGGLEKDYADAVATDAWGNVYVSGYTLSTDNIATVGAFQTTFEGSDIANNAGDAFIAKYNCSGEQLWATYYGGEAAERAWNIVADDYGNIYVAGFTNLLSGLPSTDNLATLGSHQATPGGSDGDLFLAKFDGDGNRIWATYYGGAGKENSATLPVGLALDHAGHVYLCGTTNSTDAIATAGSYQSSLSGSNDAFLVQFDTAGVRGWATYYGGSGNDRGESIVCDTAGNIYLTGITSSSADIASSGAHQATFGGGSDAFLVKFNSSGGREWATYYGGTGNADEGMSLFADTALNIYLAGRTNSSAGISSSGSFQDTYGGGLYDAFLVKFDASGVRQWGTYFGGINNGSVQGYNALTGDAYGNIFLTGIARATDSLSTPGSYQESVAGADDGFIASFTDTGGLNWATYYGGAGTDMFNAMDADKLGNLYLAGATTSDAAFATAGSAQDILSGGYDAFLLKFSDTAYVGTIDTIYGPLTVCAGAAQYYYVLPVPGATGYNWTLPSGWSGTSDTTGIDVIAGDTGGVISVAPVFPCADGAAFSIEVEGLAADVLAHTETEACFGDTLQLDATLSEGLSWQWLADDAPVAGATDSILQVFASGAYRVIISKGACTDTSEAVAVTIHDLPIVAITVSGDTLKAGLGFTAYQWRYEGTDIAGAVLDYYLPVIDGSYSVVVTDTNGCEGISDPVAFELPTGIKDLLAGAGIRLYPNPVSDRLYIESERKLSGRLSSIDGRLLASFDVPGTLDVSMLPEGLYMLLLHDDLGQLVKAYKLVKAASR